MSVDSDSYCVFDGKLRFTVLCSTIAALGLLLAVDFRCQIEPVAFEIACTYCLFAEKTENNSNDWARCAGRELSWDFDSSDCWDANVAIFRRRLFAGLVIVMFFLCVDSRVYFSSTS